MPSSKDMRVRHYVRQYEDKKKRRQRRGFLATPMRVLFYVLFLAVAIYFGIEIHGALNQSMSTVTALSTTVNDEISAVGYFLRSETQIAQDYDGLLQYVAEEGQKVAKTQLYANVFENPSAAEMTQEIESLTQRISTLETALSYSTRSAGTSAEGGTQDAESTENLSESIRSLMIRVNTAADTRSYAQMKDSVSELKTDIINRDFAFGSYEEVQQTISRLKETRTRLQNSIGQRERGLYTPRAGYFSTVVDGYESMLTPSTLKNMTVDTYRQLESFEPEILPNVVGKIVTDYSWYFITMLSAEECNRLSVNQTVYLQFDATGELQVKATVYDIRRQGETDGLVIFTSDREIESLISLRKQSARIIVQTYEGLKVPKNALRVDSEYNIGVYVITGMYTEFKRITPVYETEDYYIVKTDPTKTSSLLKYDEIIVSGRDLENKRVIA